MTIMLSSQDGQIWELPWQHGISTAKALLILMCNNNDYGAFVWKLYLESKFNFRVFHVYFDNMKM